MQLQKFFAPFSGLVPHAEDALLPLRLVVERIAGRSGAGGWRGQHLVELQPVRERAAVGITSLPRTRSTEGQFPYWLGVDDRLIADEFFRGSYTSGVWLKGELSYKLKYMAMFANNLSTLGVSAAQLDNQMDTQSYSLQWLPSTGEFGLWGTFGDYDDHQNVATRVGVHFTHSLEEKQSQPGTEGIENSQIRLTDGSSIFTPNLFGPGITVNEVDYNMMSVDAGVKYKGMSLEGEYYWRWLRNYTGINTERHCRHQRHWLSAAGLSDGRSKGSSAVLRLLRRYSVDYGDPVGSASRTKLLPDERARDSPQRRVDVRRPFTGGLHGVSLSSRREGPGVPHQPRVELLILTRHDATTLRDFFARKSL